MKIQKIHNKDNTEEI